MIALISRTHGRTLFDLVRIKILLSEHSGIARRILHRGDDVFGDVTLIEGGGALLCDGSECGGVVRVFQ
ncbi:Uncharacterised protein [Vibrio cholerae]|uniref:Uncharacterized protein n=1 Tax=Vibrio cholerae TaxID=666 RepID=A0A655YCD0_VIBCL|nr:Uncharacterised protein [Vibrio cholerae]CSB91689.1 Uncharacterised protein [Vibrio cholerae]CSC34937.1 Uncharacterised protein [Vibrio cholerae]